MTGRRYRLSPWIVRALIPPTVIGVYVLWSPTAPVYVGRSDTSLRRRLLEHSRSWPDIFFTYDVAFSPEDAYRMECCLFHALGDHTTNIDHPQRVSIDQTGCDSACSRVTRAISSRVRARNGPPEAVRMTRATRSGRS